MKTSDRYNKNYPVSWEQLHRDCRALSWKLLDKRKDWSRIITVARGGLVPAAIIARELNIHLVDTICIVDALSNAAHGRAAWVFRVVAKTALFLQYSRKRPRKILFHATTHAISSILARS